MTKKKLELIDWIIVAATFMLVIGAWYFLSPPGPLIPNITGHSTDI